MLSEDKALYFLRNARSLHLFDKIVFFSFTVLVQNMYLHDHYLQETWEILFVVKELSQNVRYFLKICSI